MLVVDASVLAPAVADGSRDGPRFRSRLRGETLAGPDLLRVEVTWVLRFHASTGRLTPGQADAAIGDLLDFPLEIFPTGPLLRRVWELRSNLSACDACSVALAEAVGGVLVTVDRRLAGTPGPRCRIEAL